MAAESILKAFSSTFPDLYTGGGGTRRDGELPLVGEEGEEGVPVVVEPVVPDAAAPDGDGKIGTIIKQVCDTPYRHLAPAQSGGGWGGGGGGSRVACVAWRCCPGVGAQQQTPACATRHARSSRPRAPLRTSSTPTCKKQRSRPSRLRPERSPRRTWVSGEGPPCLCLLCCSGAGRQRVLSSVQQRETVGQRAQPAAGGVWRGRTARLEGARGLTLACRAVHTQRTRRRGATRACR